MDSISWLRASVGDVAEEFIILIVGDSFWIHQPQWLQFIDLIAVECHWESNEVTVFFDDG